MEQKELAVNARLIGNTAYMLLNAPIGYDKNSTEPYINGGTFAQRMYDYSAQGYKVVVKINSPGGQVVDGLNIVDAITSVGADTHNIGIAASMAGVILMSGKNRKADSGTAGMVHAAHGGNSELKDIMRNSLSGIMDKRTKFPKDKITEMMTGAGMHWFDASEMLANGMVDEVIETEAKFYKPDTKNAVELYKIYNSLNQTENDMNFFDMVKAKFGGNTEGETAVNVLSVKADLETSKSENVALKAKIVELETKIAAVEADGKKVTVNALVDGAIAAGKIKEEQKAFWVTSATADIEGAKLVFASLAATKTEKTKSAASIVDVKAKVETDDKETYAYLEKNDPAKLQAILESDPDKFLDMLSIHEKTPKEKAK